MADQRIRRSPVGQQVGAPAPDQPAARAAGPTRQPVPGRHRRQQDAGARSSSRSQRATEALERSGPAPAPPSPPATRRRPPRDPPQRPQSPREPRPRPRAATSPAPVTARCRARRPRGTPAEARHPRPCTPRISASSALPAWSRRLTAHPGRPDRMRDHPPPGHDPVPGPDHPQPEVGVLPVGPREPLVEPPHLLEHRRAGRPCRRWPSGPSPAPGRSAPSRSAAARPASAPGPAPGWPPPPPGSPSRS